ncbi:uncharacterized protein LOC116396175 isoform X2 [Anarrhichthys ocellatus]|uniref:uncharacterized protein LOC116396175 isoform X2 n=1 Tax=Anarrhichthys ocellatus TaxID=433405 RepID=UPI0012ECBBF1|nr:uncharacterized protein LOC116396175 isoform X2 [Anarrhichthys ocellatus]
MSKLQYGFEMNFGGTLLFEGEQDHLIPSTWHYLLESDFFVVAGRMIGHSFLHSGPCLGGLSPAILHVLFGGSPEEAIIDIKDCADLDIRETIKVVLGRTSKQVKQLRSGLKETPIWPLLTERKDTIPLLFTRASDVQCTPQMVLEKIKWPTEDEDEDSDVSLEDTCRTTGFLRTFIETASPSILGKLVQFWIGWNVLLRHQLDINVVELKLPGHYKDYCNFERDILAAICSTDTGFGLV